MTSAYQAVVAYWAAIEARDWESLAGLVAGDVFYEVPQTRERVRGREAFIRFCAEGFPGEWHIAVERAAGDGQHAASWVRWSPGGNGTQSGLSFFDLGGDGLIARITDFWPEPYEPPANRAHLVERY
ncbi:MAG TPA: nuclear transport factor 2 family protein [Streptosporangiaceae bacterium]|nr:nuclear transport factor 2 family protein [Streptosporangiaceae bacterium]